MRQLRSRLIVTKVKCHDPAVRTFICSVWQCHDQHVALRSPAACPDTFEQDLVCNMFISHNNMPLLTWQRQTCR